MALKESFANVQRPPDSPATTVTLYDLQALRAQRAKPALERHLTPAGAATGNPVQDRNREERISDIEKRLQTGRDQAMRDFARAGMRGRAKADFDRER